MQMFSNISIMLQNPYFYILVGIFIVLLFIIILIFTDKGRCFIKLFFDKIKVFAFKKEEIYIELDQQKNCAAQNKKTSEIKNVKMKKSSIGKIEGNVHIKNVDMLESTIGEVNSKNV